MAKSKKKQSSRGSSKKKTKKKKKKAARKPRAPTAMIVMPGEAPSEVPAEPKYLRLAAANTYITTPGMSLVDLLKHKDYAGVLNEGLIKAWSRQDGWVAQREAYVERLQTHIQAKVGSDLANLRSAQILAFQNLYDKALEKIVLMFTTEEAVEFKSPEAALGSITRMFIALDDQRAKLMEQVIPEVPRALETPMDDDGEMHQALVPKLAQDEAREVISLLLAKRRDKMRAELVAAGELTEEDLHGDVVPQKKKKRPPKKKVKKS